MTPQAWIGLAALVVNCLVLVLGAGIYFGRQETRGTRHTDSDELVVRRVDPYVLSAASRCDDFDVRLTTFEKEWRNNREVWHERFRALDDARVVWAKDADQLYVRKESIQSEIRGIWAVLKRLEKQRST